MTIKILLTAFGLLTIFSTANAQTQSTSAQTAPTDSSAIISGKWTGSYDGTRSGTFELVINPNDSRKLTGQITMLPPAGSGKAIPLKSVTFQGGRLSAAYDDPENGEVNLTGTLRNPSLTGTWQLAGGQASGDWQLTRAGR